MANQVFEGRPGDKAHAIRLYNRNVEEVMETVDTVRLLVHNLGDGWGPLCNCLDLPVPEIEYPNGNTSKQFNKRMATRFLIGGILSTPASRLVTR